MIFTRIEAVKDSVAQVRIPQLVAQKLDRLEFGCVGWPWGGKKSRCIWAGTHRQWQ